MVVEIVMVTVGEAAVMVDVVGVIMIILLKVYQELLLQLIPRISQRLTWQAPPLLLNPMHQIVVVRVAAGLAYDKVDLRPQQWWFTICNEFALRISLAISLPKFCYQFRYPNFVTKFVTQISLPILRPKFRYRFC